MIYVTSNDLGIALRLKAFLVRDRAFAKVILRAFATVRFCLVNATCSQSQVVELRKQQRLMSASKSQYILPETFPCILPSILEMGAKLVALNLNANSEFQCLVCG